MRVRELIGELSKLDPEAEVMVSTPSPYKHREVFGPGALRLPSLKVETGAFAGGALEGVPWAMIMATDCWDLFQSSDGDLRLPERPELTSPQPS